MTRRPVFDGGDAVVSSYGTPQQSEVQQAFGAALPGTTLTLSAEQLGQADDYEVDVYARIGVVLGSGTAGWVYSWAGATA